MTEAKLNLSALKELFARALMTKLMSVGSRPGRHYRTRGAGGGRKGKHNPAGTKLVRRFIRQGRGEQTEYRRMYAAMTGHQYGA